MNDSVDKILNKQDLVDLITEFTEGDLEKFRFLFIVGISNDGQMKVNQAGSLSQLECRGFASEVYDHLLELAETLKGEPNNKKEE